MQVRKDLYHTIRVDSYVLSMAADSNSNVDIDAAIRDLNTAIEKRLTIPNVDRNANDIRCLDACYWRLADLYSRRGMHAKEAEAIKHAKHFLFMFKSFSGKDEAADNQYEGQYYFSLGNSYSKQGLEDKAIKYFAKAVEHFEMFKDFSDMTAYQFARSMVNLATLTKKFDPEVYKKAIDVLQKYVLESADAGLKADAESLIKECKQKIEMTQKIEQVSIAPKADDKLVEQVSLPSAAVNPSALFAGSAQKRRRREPEVDVSLIIPERKTRSGKRFGQ